MGTKFALSQRLLGDAYSAETPPRYDMAMIAYMTAAAMGDSRSAIQLGKMYLMGRGVAYDPAKAAQWIAESAESGDQEAVFQGGLLYLRGVGVPKSERLAAEDFMRAANAGVHSRGGSIGLVLCERDRSEQGLEPGDPLAVSGGTQNAGSGGPAGEASPTLRAIAASAYRMDMIHAPRFGRANDVPSRLQRHLHSVLGGGLARMSVSTSSGQRC